MTRGHVHGSLSVLQMMQTRAVCVQFSPLRQIPPTPVINTGVKKKEKRRDRTSLRHNTTNLKLLKLHHARPSKASLYPPYHEEVRFATTTSTCGPSGSSGSRAPCLSCAIYTLSAIIYTLSTIIYNKHCTRTTEKPGEAERCD